MTPELYAWTIDRPNRIFMTGNEAGLRRLSLVLQEAELLVGDLIIPLDVRPDRPDLAEIIIKPQGGSKVAVSTKEGRLKIEGDQSHLAVLGRNIERLSTDYSQPDKHTHVEYWPSHPFLDESTIPLVVYHPLTGSIPDWIRE